MVNVGGPSKGCRTCIQRRIRCDRQRPICGQCVKSKRHCRGYRDEAETFFRDQTPSVIMVRRDSGKLSSHKGSSASPATELLNDPNATSSGGPSLTPSPGLKEEDGLVAFFMNNYTCDNFRPGTNLFWVSSNFRALLKLEHLRISVQSVGAMAIARLQRSSHYERKAQRLYGSALLSLAAETRHEAAVDQDSVLFTIMFLAFFEILASYNSGSRQSWLTHLHGLGMLLGRRTQEFLRSGTGSRMLFQSRNQALVDALRFKTPLPEVHQKRLPPTSFTLPEPFVHTEKADLLLIRLASLQHQCQFSQHHRTLLSELTALDRDLCRWIAELPGAWVFSEQTTPYHSGLWWDVRCDIYLRPVLAHTWNKVRAGRILVLDMIHDIMSRKTEPENNGLSPCSDQLSVQFSILQIRCLTIDICATIPIYYRPSSSVDGHHSSASPPLLGTVYWLLWPLEVLGCMRQASPELVHWLLQCLERIYDTTGNAKALMAANVIKKKSRESAKLIDVGDTALVDRREMMHTTESSSPEDIIP